MIRLKRVLRKGFGTAMVPMGRLPAIKRHRAFLEAGAAFAVAESTAERDAAAQSLLTAIARYQLQQVAPNGLAAAKGRAAALLSEELVQSGLSNTAHLGALAALSPVRATRLDYVALILDQLLQLKESKAVGGLSSRPNEWSVGTRLELMQCWAILHNWGHLFGTFATERGLVFQLDADPSFQNQLMSDANLHERLRNPVREAMARRNLHHAFYSLACLRASTELSGRLRNDACTALAVFFEHQRNRTVEHELYRRVRRLAYQRLHSIMRLERACDFATAPAAVTELTEGRELRNDGEAPVPPLVSLLEGFDRYHNQEIFSSPRAAAYVLNHNRALKWWWERQPPADALQRVRTLYSRPSDWPLEEPDDLKHWARIRYSGDASRWVDEVREWAKNCEWSNGNFLVSPLPDSRGLTCDLYVGSSVPGPSPPMYLGVSRALASKCMTGLTRSSGDEELGRSLGRLVSRCLGELLLPDNIVELERAPGMGAAGWAVSLLGADAARELKRLTEQVGDEKRKAELRGLVADMERHPPDAGAVVFCVIGRTRLLDEESGAEKKELDGVWAVLDNDSVTWRFIEEKSSRRTGRESQLSDLQALLRAEITRPERLDGYPDVAVTSCVWRG